MNLQQELRALNNSMAEMKDEARKLMDEVEQMKTNFTWSIWEPHTVGIIPKRINGRWYFKGDTVYRRQRLGPGGTQYKYGDDFDRLKDIR